MPNLLSPDHPLPFASLSRLSGASTEAECLLTVFLEASQRLPGWRWAQAEAKGHRLFPIRWAPGSEKGLNSAEGWELSVSNANQTSSAGLVVSEVVGVDLAIQFHTRLASESWLLGWAPSPLQGVEATIWNEFQIIVRDAARVLRRLAASQALERNATQSERLSEATRLMGAAPDLNSLLQVLTSEAQALVPLPHWWYNRFDPKTRLSQTEYWTPNVDDLFDIGVIQDPDPVDGVPLLEQLHYEHTPIYIPYCEDHPYFTETRLKRFPHRSLVGLPLVYEGRVAGVLMGGTFGDEGHLTLQEARPQVLQSLCEAGALAINRLEALRELEESEGRFRDLFEGAPDAILIMDECRILDANAGAAALFGLTREELAKARFWQMAPPLQPSGQPSEALALDHLAKTKAGIPQQFEWMATHSDGHAIQCEASLTMLRRGTETLIHTIVRDITARERAKEEQKKLEHQLFQAQKMESLGVLAGGIAHDFNNLLVGVLGYAGLASESLTSTHPVNRYLEFIKQAAHKAANLTRQMLAYSGRGEFLIEEINLGIQVEEIVHLLEVSVPKHVLLRRVIDRNLPLISADASQIQQVIMNLVINAAEAIGEASGVITVVTGLQDLDESYIERVLVGQTLTPGRYIYLEVTDTGCGMSLETQSRIFEPFYTTKFTGRGLGMSALLGIIRGHTGGIQLYSEVGRGTTFKVFFPLANQDAEAIPEAPKAGAWRGSGLGLVVDDDETTRAVAREILERLGFEILEARDGLEGVELVRQLGASLRFVLLDMTMPRMGGEAAFREMRALIPNIRVLLSSGYSEHEVTVRLTGRRLMGFVQKPYPPELLAEHVKALLSEGE